MIPQTPTEKTSFNLAFQAEVIVLVEIEMPSTRVEYYDEQKNVSFERIWIYWKEQKMTKIWNDKKKKKGDQLRIEIEKIRELPKPENVMTIIVTGIALMDLTVEQ